MVLSTTVIPSGLDWLPRSYLWRDGVLTELGEGEVNDFNDAGDIAGFSFDVRTFLRWRDDQRRVLATDCPHGTRLYLRGPARINRLGQIAATFACGDELAARLWVDDEVLELPTLAGNIMMVTDLNDETIVGWVIRDGQHVPVRRDGGPLVEVALPAGVRGGEIRDIDEQGRFMGVAYRTGAPPDRCTRRATASCSSVTATARTSSSTSGRQGLAAPGRDRRVRPRRRRHRRGRVGVRAHGGLAPLHHPAGGGRRGRLTRRTSRERHDAQSPRSTRSSPLASSFVPCASLSDSMRARTVLPIPFVAGTGCLLGVRLI
ncbi:hypothetical protein [Nannocystis pusilla]|uniref:hypothetical protein n=1 Tax=Nannocystis pusilla TaxID=889268 RepID=UPI003B82B6DC